MLTVNVHAKDNEIVFLIMTSMMPFYALYLVHLLLLQFAFHYVIAAYALR